MPLSWNEIRRNATAFSHQWAGATDEVAEAKTFWDEFFQVFGVKRRVVASFEARVRNLAGNWSFIDLFWRGTLLVEHKSRGRSLEKAGLQAMEYIQCLKDAGRDEEIPRYVVVSDFERIALHDLEGDESSGPRAVVFALKDLPRHIHEFAFIPGYRQYRATPQDPVNIRAVELLGDLHDSLEDGGYSGHDLERFLVRVLFCLFAEDTGIFEPGAFTLFVENHTREDGADLGPQLERFFQVLDTESSRRQKNLLEELAELPHVNGELFRERLRFADFNRAMREQLLRCCGFDWSRISPAVFGSLFQSVMEPRERREIGAHYTSERDILKVVKSLFLDDLRAEFERIRRNKSRLREFHEKLGRLRFLDPACGCGNFLVVTYRELRLLELDVLKALCGKQKVIDVHDLSRVDVDAMYGIEILEFPCRIAEVAMWLIDHQMNQALSAAFGQYFVRLPLRKSAIVRQANAVGMDWNTVLSSRECAYVLGNPPFVGSRYQSEEQRADLRLAADGLRGAGVLDYVSAWYLKAAEYIKGTRVRVGFVSTNSITQGEQVGVLWSELFRRGIKIHFAHRTFPWQSEARGKAHVHVVIVGFGAEDAPEKWIHDYELGDGEPTAARLGNISPYLVEGSDSVVLNRGRPMCDVPGMLCGNQPIDDGQYLFTSEEKAEFLKREPGAKKWFRRWVGSREFIHGEERWCLWLGDCPPEVLRQLPECRKRVEAVRVFRSKSKRDSTRKLARTPTRFQVETMPAGEYLLVPSVSSERRPYIPIDFAPRGTLVSNLGNAVENATLYHFGVLTSAMHMAWVRQVCGRLKSDYRYSVKLVYNNYPWPENVSDARRVQVERKARAVLDARAQSPGASLASLYDPTTMPSRLAKAHAELDKAVDLCYRKSPFHTDRDRMEFLMALLERFVADDSRRRPNRRMNNARSHPSDEGDEERQQ